MTRYENKLFHWKLQDQLAPSKCYTGDASTDENTRLRIKISDLEWKQKKMKEKDDLKIDVEILESQINNLKEIYKTKKEELIKNASYEMFPDNTLIHCQLISPDGKNIKADGSFGNELVWCKVCDQSCFRSDILYAVKIIKDGKVTDNFISTRASLTNWPTPSWAPDSYLKDCDPDDSITGPYCKGDYDSMPELESECCSSDDESDDCLAAGGGLHASRKLGEEKEIKEKLKESFQNSGMSESDASFLTCGVEGMDDNNLKMANVMAEKGMDEAVKQMFVHPTEGRQMSYSEMRSFYG